MKPLKKYQKGWNISGIEIAKMIPLRKGKENTMNKTIILVMVLCITSFSFLYCLEPIKSISDGSLVILNSNVIIFRVLKKN